MTTLRLVYGEDEAPEIPDVYPFPGVGTTDEEHGTGGHDCPWEVPTDAAEAVERAIRLVQTHLDDLSDALDPIPFPAREDDPPPTAA